MPKILEVKNLNVRFDKEEVVKDLNFGVEKGEILTILGPNGAGKSTLLRALMGFLPYQGEVSWQEGAKISYLPENLSRESFRVIPLSLKDFFSFEKASLN